MEIIESIMQSQLLESRWIKEAILEGQNAFKTKIEMARNPYKEQTKIALLKNYGWILGWTLAYEEYQDLKQRMEAFFDVKR